MSADLCHAAVDANALIHAARCSGDGSFVLLAHVSSGCSAFFIDHPIDHVPGLVFTSMMRQGALVISHLYLGVPRSWSFLLERIEMRFLQFAPSSASLALRVDLRACRLRRQFMRVELEADVLANDRCVARGQMEFRAYTPDGARRVRRAIAEK